jgi:hypothetical protein
MRHTQRAKANRLGGGGGGEGAYRSFRSDMELHWGGSVPEIRFPPRPLHQNPAMWAASAETSRDDAQRVGCGVLAAPEVIDGADGLAGAAGLPGRSCLFGRRSWRLLGSNPAAACCRR